MRTLAYVFVVVAKPLLAAGIISRSFASASMATGQIYGDGEVISTARKTVEDVALDTPNLSLPVSPVEGWFVDDSGLTNPSMLIHGGEVWIALRRLSKGHAPKDQNVSELVNPAWISTVVFAQMSLHDFRHMASSGAGSARYGNAPSIRFRGTESSKVECLLKTNVIRAFGEEDPRIFTFAGKRYMYVVGTEPVPKNAPGLRMDSTGYPHCLVERTEDGTWRGGMFLHLAEIRGNLPHVTFGPRVPLLFNGMHIEEKGWSMFEWSPDKAEKQLLAVYSVDPHIVLQVDPSTGSTSMRFNESSKRLLSGLAATYAEPGLNVSRINGGSGVVLMQGHGKPYYLSVLHFHWYKSDYSVRKYYHYAYKFRAEPPFDMISVASKALPLKAEVSPFGSFVNYVSSLIVDKGDVVIGYGQDDRIARFYRQPIEDFDREFFSDTA